MKLTNKELSLIQDSDFLLTKVKIISKIFRLLENTENNLREIINNTTFKFPLGTKIKYGKISKGEAYLNLPYLILDYPTLFSNADIFAYRTMFWWGNFFSATLHLQGESLKIFRNKIIDNYKHLLNQNIYICVADNPWEYNYKKNNYVLLKNSNNDILNSHPFIKLSKKLELNEYKNLQKFSSDFFKLLLDILM